MASSENIIQSLIAKNRSGINSGIASLCSANIYVIKAALRFAKENNIPLLIEATSNQVNQFGGYTGYTPQDFKELVFQCAANEQFPAEKVILGGDHLGPNAWQDKNSHEALLKSENLVAAYVAAGFSKIHLDASMKCADDGKLEEPLSPEIIAERTARLCKAAESSYDNTKAMSHKPNYIIGTDVPIPGGMQEEHSSVRITTAAEVEETVALTRKAFEKYNLHDAWERVIGVVVQPGVEFGDTTVLEYEPEKTKELVSAVLQYDNIVYEAHSTDYQTKESLRRMVQDHFAILKVGPWLTYAFREAIFALATIEKELFLGIQNMQLSRIHEILESRMNENPIYWKKYYTGNPQKISFSKKYSYSDRVRYYWTDKVIDTALTHLLSNLTSTSIPLTLLSQYLPDEYDALREGRIANNPQELIYSKISHVLQTYHYATTEVIS